MRVPQLFMKNSSSLFTVLRDFSSLFVPRLQQTLLSDPYALFSFFFSRPWLYEKIFRYVNIVDIDSGRFYASSNSIYVH